MTSKYQVTREYQLGGHSTFGCNTVSGLIRTINQDLKTMRDGGDCQGVGYTMTRATAEGLGLEELRDGGWLIPGTEITVTATE